MVRAILAGTKTQTRRVVKPQPTHFNPAGVPRRVVPAGGASDVIACPYGQPGDRLWVREAFAFTDAHEPHYHGSIEYRADNKCLAVDCGPVTVDVPHNCDPRPFDGPWRPSIHMPRWASRISLEITGARVEGLQDISEEDAIAEGAPGYEEGVDAPPQDEGSEWSYRASFRRLWESINGPDSWEANPWVWVVEFRRIANA
jgi:hypothetical protein